MFLYLILSRPDRGQTQPLLQNIKETPSQAHVCPGREADQFRAESTFMKKLT
jgi:hypothetical protein